MADADPSSRRLVGVLAAAVLLLCPCSTAWADQSASFAATFAPYRLGARTTIVLNLEVHAPAGEMPSALTEVEVRYPQNLGFALSGLGLAICSAAKLEAHGTEGCPANSIMGRGRAVAELRLGPQLVSESASISIARASDQEGNIALLLYAVGPTPVDTQILAPAQLLPSAPPFGGRLNMELPVIPSVPGAPAVAITSMHVTLGPRGLTYFERVDGHTLAYTPRGILMPTKCPRRGFHFAAAFSFLDGSHLQAENVVPCPRALHRQRAPRRTLPSR